MNVLVCLYRMMRPLVRTRTQTFYLQWPETFPLIINLTQFVTAIYGSLRCFHGSDKVWSGHGDPPRQRATVTVHPYISTVPHMTNYPALRRHKHYWTNNQNLYIRRTIVWPRLYRQVFFISRLTSLPVFVGPRLSGKGSRFSFLSIYFGL